MQLFYTKAESLLRVIYTVDELYVMKLQHLQLRYGTTQRLRKA